MQAVKHCHMLGVKYGIITNYFTTWLVKCDSGTMYISRGFSYASVDPSARQVMQAGANALGMVKHTAFKSARCSCYCLVWLTS